MLKFNLSNAPLTTVFSTKTLYAMGLQHAATFINYVYNTKITQQFKQLGIPLLIFPHASREPAKNNGCGTLPQKDWAPME